jgi:hypothetical protein
VLAVLLSFRMTTTAPIGSRGTSASTESGRTNALRVFDLFLQTPGAGAWTNKRWADLPEEALTDQATYEAFAGYLTNEYVIASESRNGGKHYSVDSITGIWSNSINLAAAKFKRASQHATLFFTCLDPCSNTDDARWLKGVKANVRRICFERDSKSGEGIDHSCSPIYPCHVEEMTRALALEGSAEAAMRKFAITCGHQAAGRPTELSFVAFDSMQWDPFFTCAIAELPMSKVSRMKHVAFVAGANRHCCFFLGLADHLALGGSSAYITYEDSDTVWMFPELRRSGAPGTKLGSYVKALQPRLRGGAKKYENFCVNSLPDDLSAGGFRPGCINFLATKVCVDWIVHTTGHDLKGASALYEYLNPNRALLIPGSTVLAGFAPHPWGQLGMGPVPASLVPLLNLNVSPVVLQKMTDGLFHVDGASPPKLMARGALRPMVDAAFATVIMYYDVRFQKGEMSVVNARLRTVWGDAHPGRNPAAAHAMLVEWGKVVCAKFEVDNLHLMTRQGAGDSERVVNVVTRLVGVVEEQGREMREMCAATSALRIELSETRRQLASRDQLPAILPRFGPSAAAHAGMTASIFTATAR